ncbi:Glutamyl-tRNA reductase [Rosistilla ulvae]|uniref:Glutamyl-tRNA reductase n=1 Tax=Rosistilla ulvae TaxID=1930277 RepID=A0A517M7G8_9BACT|nr:glutamyl-tRNA reductase [Rosistilla ulvae]QDS90830.1 Glutamyl-tRNA reductase [Rosistilla ulvae]
MKLQMIGCSHHQANVEFRERLSFTGDQAQLALDAFRDRFPKTEAVLLSTCNRVEFYTATDDDSGVEQAQFIDFLADQRGLAQDQLMEHLICRNGNEAIEHLFTVAASLDSMVVGEPQILAQVKQAYELACTQGSAGPLTHSIFQTASRVAKRVASETAIHKKRVSVPSVAVGEIAVEFFERMDDKRIVLIGAGEMGRETLQYLRDKGARDVRLINRHRQRADEAAAELGARSAAWEEMHDLLADADLVVSTTAATEPIMDVQRFGAIHQARYGRMLLILDLAVPRDFDPKIGELSGVYLYSVDDLQAACHRNQREREKEWPKAKRIIEDETRDFVTALHHRATGPVIKRLREQTEQVKQDELARLIGRLESAGASDEIRREVTQAFDRLVNKMLHPPMASLKDDVASGGNHGLLDALRKLFQLNDE